MTDKQLSKKLEIKSNIETREILTCIDNGLSQKEIIDFIIRLLAEAFDLSDIKILKKEIDELIESYEN